MQVYYLVLDLYTEVGNVDISMKGKQEHEPKSKAWM